jgi:hypothetical protein
MTNLSKMIIATIIFCGIILLIGFNIKPSNTVKKATTMTEYPIWLTKKACLVFKNMKETEPKEYNYIKLNYPTILLLEDLCSKHESNQ